MSSSIKAGTVAGIATSVIQEKSHDEYEQYAKSKMMLSFIHSLKEATYLRSQAGAKPASIIVEEQ